MKQPIDPKVAVGIVVVLVVLVAGFIWWRSASQPSATATPGFVGGHRHIKPSMPGAYGGAQTSGTPGGM